MKFRLMYRRDGLGIDSVIILMLGMAHMILLNMLKPDILLLQVKIL